jgi:Ca2+-binding EF-hand superfamily protein
MQKFLLGSIAVAALAAATVAIAQPAAPTAAAPVVHPVPHAMPVHVMQPQTRNGVVEKVRAHFAELDTNRDGYLTREEAQAGHAKMKMMRMEHIKSAKGHASMKDPGAMFDRLDANHDGTISREEFNSGHQKRHAMRVDHDGDGQPDRRMHAMRGHGMRLGGRMFGMADANRDSRVSLQEATEAALKHFDMADINRDGTLTRDERQQMRIKMKEAHRVKRTS